MSNIAPPYRAEVYRIKPDDFTSTIQAAACYISANDHYLLLHRAKGLSQEYTWGNPAGKFENGETPQLAVVREVREETGICLKEDELQKVGQLYVRYPHAHFTYHMFKHEFSHRPDIHLSEEHDEYRWVTMEEALKLPLISGGRESFCHFLALSSQTTLPRRDFYFVRHGQTDVNVNPYIKHVDSDLSLNDQGTQQAKRARLIASQLPIKRLHSSPILRATQTRDILLEALDVSHTEDNCLSECKADVWMKMVRLERGGGYEVSHPVQNFLTRAIKGIETALQEEGVPLIVAHGGIHWAICYHLGIEDHPWKIGNCQVVHFRPENSGRWKASIIA